MSLPSMISTGSDVLDVISAAYELSPHSIQTGFSALENVLGRFGRVASLYEVGDKVLDGHYGSAIVEGGKLFLGRSSIVVSGVELMMFFGKSATPQASAQYHNSALYWWIQVHNPKANSYGKKYAEEKAIKYEKLYFERLKQYGGD